MKAFLLTLIVLLVPAAAAASMPVGQKFGPWRVSSITSLSGVRGDDAAAHLGQQAWGGEISVHWRQEGRVSVSIRLEKCTEDSDFSQSYEVPPERWLAVPQKKLARRLKSDFDTWIAQAELACTGLVARHQFDMQEFESAFAAFNAQVTYLGSFQSGRR